VEETAGWGVRPARLSRTLDAFNQAMLAGDDRALDVPRQAYRAALTEPPFYAIALVPAITFTFGGLRADGRCRVLDRHGRPIPTLFAAGADVGGSYVDTYGGGLAMAMALGYVAGEAAAGPA
jgi:predicted oxidoreductase